MALLIAERLNSGGSRSVADGISRRDSEAIVEIARRQARLGADYLDVNAAAWGEAVEAEALRWLVQTVQEAVDVPLSLDSVNPAAICRVLPLCRRPPLLNCFSAVSPPEVLFPEVLSLAGDYPDLPMIAVCYDGRGTQTSPSERVEIAVVLVERFREQGAKTDSLIFDPVTLPASCGAEALEITLETAQRLGQQFRDVRVLGVPSNYSYGLARRRQAECSYAEKMQEAGASIFLGNIWNPDLRRCLGK